MSRIKLSVIHKLLLLSASFIFIFTLQYGTTGTDAQTVSPARKSYQFINGQWFNGKGFSNQIFYSVNGVLTQKKPEKVDEVIDLKNGYIVPPFADAHSHYFDSPGSLSSQINMYLKDGIFYAKVPMNKRSGALKVADKVNIPTSIDISYSHGGLTSSNGHGVQIYEGLALFRQVFGFNAEQIKKLRESRLMENDAYYIIDSKEDLEQKWSKILEAKPDFIKIVLTNSEEYDEQKKRTDRIGKVGIDPKLASIIVDKAHTAGLRVSAHVDTVTDYRIALKAGVDEMAHLPGYLFELNENPDKYKLTDKDVKETAQRGVWVVPAPIAFDIFNPQHQSFNKQLTEHVDTAKIHNLKLLKKYNVKIAFGSDWYGRTALKDVMYIHKLGIFSNLEILNMWCKDTPQTIFPNRKIGVFKEGYEASFLVLNGNPLTDLNEVQNIRLRFKQGNFIELENNGI